MKNRKKTIVWIMYVLISFLLMQSSFAQTDKKQQLEAKKSKIEKEIAYTNQLLSKTKKSKKSSLNEVIILNRKINKREELINTLGDEVNYIDRQIADTRIQIAQQQKKLEELKKEYEKLIYQAYRNKSSYSRIMFLLSSEDFNQAFQRLRYIQRYSEYRKHQAETIKKTQLELAQLLVDLESIKNEKVVVLDKQEGEKQKLRVEKKEKDKQLTSLQRKERELKRSIQNKQREARKLQKTIDDIIAREIAKSVKSSKTEPAKSKKSFALTPDEVLISNSFAANKGKLPWPSERGVVSSTFGQHAHPVIRNIKTNNNGIDILTNDGAEARAIYNGTVTAVKTVMNYKNVVIIRHGEYLSVYTNLSSVYVSTGDKVKTKDPIGAFYTDPETNKTEFHFEIRKGFNLLNPVSWLAGK